MHLKHAYKVTIYLYFIVVMTLWYWQISES